MERVESDAGFDTRSKSQMKVLFIDLFEGCGASHVTVAGAGGGIAAL